ncbi:MAG: hypothetical protein GF411_02910 [Candidatus Lokiarchaeota archaeon]|nr:hypothetical protein [Candidatus Lokiarchaeota archaeon]
MDLLDTLRALNGYWHYEGGRYLAKLTSGKISDTFCNMGVLTCRPSSLSLAASGLIRKLNDAVDGDQQDFYVCGPAMGGVTLAYEVARQLGGTAIYTEPVYEAQSRVENIDFKNVAEIPEGGFSIGGVGTVVPQVYTTGQALKRFEIPEGATVLFVEDVITSGKTVFNMVESVVKHRPYVTDTITILPYVLCLVNLSGHTHSGVGHTAFSGALSTHGLEIISLADVKARTWNTITEATVELCVKCDETNNPPEVTARNEMHVEIDPFLKLEAVCPKYNWDLLMNA